MWRIKRRRTKPKTVDNKVIYPKFNATSVPKKYIQRNTYLDMLCEGAGRSFVGCQCTTDASGNMRCCQSAPYRNPILGYRWHSLDCSNCTIPIDDISGNVYKDPYAKVCGDPVNHLVCYNPVIKPKQNKNGCTDEAYNYTTAQYLNRRCRTYKHQLFNFLSNQSKDECCTSWKVYGCCCGDTSGNCVVDCSNICISIKGSPCDVRRNNCFATYKPSNRKFSHQGAVSGGSRINRLKYQTQVRAASTFVGGKTNVVNRTLPSSLYKVGRPLTMLAPGCWLNRGRTYSGLAQRCLVENPNCCPSFDPGIGPVLASCTGGLGEIVSASRLSDNDIRVTLSPATATGDAAVATDFYITNGCLPSGIIALASSITPPPHGTNTFVLTFPTFICRNHHLFYTCSIDATGPLDKLITPQGPILIT